MPERKRKGPKVALAIVILAIIAAAAIFVALYVFHVGGKVEQVVMDETPIEATATVNETLEANDDAATAQPASKVNSPEAEAAIVFTMFGDADTIVLKGESYVEPGAHAVENRAKDISSSIQVEGKVDTTKVGDYPVTYAATSSTGLQVQRTRTVHVVESMSTTNSVPVLMYHYVYTATDMPDNVNNNYLLDTDLEAQLQYLTANDFYYPSYKELRAFIDGTHSLPAKSVVLTFDDGERGFLSYGIPLLEKYKVPATSFLIGCDDNIIPCTANASPYVTFQSHSFDMHQPGGTKGHGGIISALTQAQILDDLQTNIRLLGTSDAFAYPFGDTTSEGQAAVTQAGILCAFTTQYGYVHAGDDPTLLSRVRVIGSADLSSYIASIS